MDLKWMLRRSRRMAAAWVTLMSGVISIVWGALTAYLAATSHPAPANAAWNALGPLAMIAFVVAGITVLLSEHRRADSAEVQLAAVREAPSRLFLLETADRIVIEIAETKWHLREALAASYVGKWARGRGRVTNVVRSGRDYNVLISNSHLGQSGPVALDFPHAERVRLEILDQDHLIEYEGKISVATESYVRLTEVQFKHVRPPVPENPS